MFLAPSSKPGTSRKSAGKPVIIRPDKSTPTLERIALDKGGAYNEAWLQALIHDHPQILPINDIEPGFGTPIPVAMEVACGAGFIDNLYLTPSGEIILVETKLWRNVQARREVVAQALDYVAALMGLGYQGFETAILKARGGGASLYALVADQPDAADESSFIDAVSRNLRRGRMLVIALGDGIRQEAEALAELLQSHAGAHFTFALVEIGTWRNVETGDIIAVPNTLAQTVMIERGIVVIDESGMPMIKPMPTGAVTKAQSITEEMFYEALAKRNPGLPTILKAFVAKLAPLGVYGDFKRTLQLRVDIPEQAKPLTIGYIQTNGQIWTTSVISSAPHAAAMHYLERLAAMIDGQVTQKADIYVSTNGSSAPYIDQLLPTHAEEWETAVRDLVLETQEALPA